MASPGERQGRGQAADAGAHNGNGEPSHLSVRSGADGCNVFPEALDGVGLGGFQGRVVLE
jgi:hypothetical protein